MLENQTQPERLLSIYVKPNNECDGIPLTMFKLLRLLSIYVKPNNECDGTPLTTFKLLSEPYQTRDLIINLYDENDNTYKVIVNGYSSLFFGNRTMCSVALVQHKDIRGYLIYGADAGLVYHHLNTDDNNEYDEELSEHHVPVIFINEGYSNDLPENVIHYIQSNLLC